MAMFKRVSATALDVSGSREAPKVGPHRLRSQANRGSRCQSAITCKLAEIMGFLIISEHWLTAIWTEPESNYLNKIMKNKQNFTCMTNESINRSIIAGIKMGSILKRGNTDQK